MTAVGIICEYNPFHRGHQIQIDAVRSRVGKNVCIVALMSGDFVQRGGPALLPKEARAAIALSHGIDLVLELPFPWSMSGADQFAAGAVEILEGLSGVDYLSFGSESAELDVLREVAAEISSPEFDYALGEEAKHQPNLSFAALRENAYLRMTGKMLPRLASNDLLGVAYLSHLQSIRPLPIKRLPGYSAGEARRAFQERDYDVLREQVPSETLEALRSEKQLQQEIADAALLSYLHLTPPEQLATYAECNREIAARLANAAMSAVSVAEIVESATSKHYTAARIRRALWHSFLQTPSELPKSLPHFTNLLAANERGRAFLRTSTKRSRITVVTRPSNAALKDVAEEYSFSEARDRVYARFSGKKFEKMPPILK